MEDIAKTVGVGLLRAVFTSEYYPQYFAGKFTNEDNLRFSAQVLRFTQDEEWIVSMVAGGLPAGYSGNALTELPGMIQRAIAKGYATPSAARQGHKQSDKDEKSKKESLASAVLRMLSEADNINLSHDDSGRAILSIREDEKGEKHFYLNSSAAKSWLRGFVHRESAGLVVPTQQFTDILNGLEAKAIYDSPKKQVFLRTARVDEGVVVNLADEENRVVIINAEGYVLSQESPALFITSRAIKPLPMPQSNGELLELQKLLGLSDGNFHRLLAFIINCLKPEGPYMFLLIEGEQGSGKSFLCLLIKQLIDPHQAPKLRLPASEQDLMIQAKENYLLAYDNISGIRSDLSDALCSLSTGGGFATRKLYTDDELQIFTESRPFILNGITGVASRPDLLERSISLKLPTMPQGQRKTEEDILKEFMEMRPRILGKLFEIVACGLKNALNTKTPTSVRMADSAKWIMAAEPATGLPEGTLIRALESSQDEVITDSIANNTVAIALVKCIEGKPFHGTVGELFDQMENSLSRYSRDFPAGPPQLSRALDRLRPALAKVGIGVEFCGKTKKGKMIRAWLEGQENEKPQKDF